MTSMPPMDWICASSHVEGLLPDLVSVIDEKFGKGYASKNPALLGAMLTAAATAYHAEALRTYLPEIAEELRAIARAVSEAS